MDVISTASDHARSLAFPSLAGPQASGQVKTAPCSFIPMLTQSSLTHGAADHLGVF